jgi:mannan endo-1,4-beta-mannosidase
LTATSDHLISSPFPEQTRSFVTTHGAQFSLDGKPWRFGGTNCYYLNYKSHYAIDSVLNDAYMMNQRVIRTWAFLDGEAVEGVTLQPEPFKYDEKGFDSLDYAVYKAGTLGIRLVMVLTNNWHNYGGMQQYVKWFLGLADDSYGDAVNHDRFYTNADIKKAYKAYARHVITRRNRYTGLPYNEDPAIMTFELANEPRNHSDKSGAALLAWADEMSRWVKELAPRQLVATGEEGFYGEPGNPDPPYSDQDGEHFIELTSLPAVDYGTFHIYPQTWGRTPENGIDPAEWGEKWIRAHLRDRARLGKPIVLEEYALRIDPTTGVPDEQYRLDAYQRWISIVESEGCDGDQYWVLVSRQEDGTLFPASAVWRVVYPDSLATLLGDHAARMGGRMGGRAPGPK